MKTRNIFQLFWLNRSNSWFKSKNGSFWCCVIGSVYNQKVFRQALRLILNLKVSRQVLWLILNLKVSRQAFQRICNPLSKNVRPLPPGDLQSPSSLFVFHSSARRSGWFSISKSPVRRSSGFAIRCQKMFDHFPPGICNPHPLYLYFILKQPARRSGWFSIRKSSARRSSGFAIRCQKMFDHFPLGICNPHPLYLYFILKQSQERL